jgi:hypothetical protein
MMTDNEWSVISKKAFPANAVKAPPFLWTRILAKIQSEETRRSSVWWLQWRLMLKVTFALGLFAMASSYYLFQQTPEPLESAWTAVSLERPVDLAPEIDS